MIVIKKEEMRLKDFYYQGHIDSLERTILMAEDMLKRFKDAREEMIRQQKELYTCELN